MPAAADPVLLQLPPHRPRPLVPYDDPVDARQPREERDVRALLVVDLVAVLGLLVLVLLVDLGEQGKPVDQVFGGVVVGRDQDLQIDRETFLMRATEREAKGSTARHSKKEMMMSGFPSEVSLTFAKSFFLFVALSDLRC